MEKLKNLELAKLEIYEDVLYHLHSIFDCVKGIKNNFLDWNYNFKRIGNYELVSKIKKGQSEIPIINFQINERNVNHKNLFEWNFIYDYSKQAKLFFEKLDNKIYDLNYEIEKFDFVDENNNFDEKKYNKECHKFEKKAQKIIKEYPKEIFKEKYLEFEKVINTILKDEYNKIYDFNDIKKEIFFNSRKELAKNEIRIDEPPQDYYFLYYFLDNNIQNVEIKGFYSLETNELLLLNNIKLKYIYFGENEFEEVQNYIKEGKTLKEWLIDYLKDF